MCQCQFFAFCLHSLTLLVFSNPATYRQFNCSTTFKKTHDQTRKKWSCFKKCSKECVQSLGNMFVQTTFQKRCLTHKNGLSKKVFQNTYSATKKCVPKKNVFNWYTYFHFSIHHHFPFLIYFLKNNQLININKIAIYV